MLMVKDREILDLKGNIAEMLAVMPGSLGTGAPPPPPSSSLLPCLSSSLLPPPPPPPGGHGGGMGSGGGMSAAPGGHRAGQGLFTPYSSASGGELGIMDLPAGTGGHSPLLTSSSLLLSHLYSSLPPPPLLSYLFPSFSYQSSPWIPSLPLPSPIHLSHSP